MNIQVNTDNAALQNSVNMNGTTNAVQSSAQMAYQLVRNVNYVSVGDTFTGQITNMDGNSLEILLSDNSLIDAKLAQSMNLSVGQSMSFEVTSAANGKIQLTPLYANLAGDSQVARALNAAELPVNAANSEMVQSMMEEGMPIDSKSLLDMARLVNSHTSAAPSSIVQMSHFNIPITDENVAQYELYRNNNHQIAGEVTKLADGYSQLAGSSMSMNRAILDIFTGPASEEVKLMLNNALSSETEGGSTEVNTEKAAYADQDAGNEGIAENTAEVKTEEPDIQPDVKMPDKAAVNGNPEISGSTDRLSENSYMKQPDGDISLTARPAVHYSQNTVTEDANQLFTPQERNVLADRMKALGVPESITEHVKDGTAAPKETLNYVKAAFDVFPKSGINSDEFMKNFKELIGSREYGKLLKNEISSELLLSPKDVADKEEVQEYFERVVRETSRAAELLNSTGRGDTTLAKGTESLRENVDFMNQMNQVFTYVQLPLKMNQESAHGDLYVYTNRKRLESNDGNVSALLHLDMEHLGTMDIHVAMNAEGNVKTHFIMQKEEMLDFIAGHLPELDRRLSERGYNMTSDVALNRQSRTVPEIMFSRGSNTRLIQKQSFDVKA